VSTERVGPFSKLTNRKGTLKGGEGEHEGIVTKLGASRVCIIQKSQGANDKGKGGEHENHKKKGEKKGGGRQEVGRSAFKFLTRFWGKSHPQSGVSPIQQF